MSETSTVPGTVIHEVFPYLCVRGAGEAIEFYKKVFGAEEIMRLTEPGGRIGHAELKFGPNIVMVADEYPEYGFLSPLAHGGTGVTVHLNVDNVDAFAERAVAAGATMLMEPSDEFYGERSCRFVDPFGHRWLLGHVIEEMSFEEMQRRYDALFEAE